MRNEGQHRHTVVLHQDSSLSGPVLVALCVLVGLAISSAAMVGVPVMSDSNVSAYVAREWTSFSVAGSSDVVGLVRPNSLLLDDRGWLYVADPEAGLVYVIRNDREIIAVFGDSSEATLRIPGMAYPCDLAMDSQGRLYISDLVSRRVYRVSRDFEEVVEIRIPDEQRGAPLCVAVDSMDRLFVGNDRVGSSSRVLVYVDEGGTMVLNGSFDLCAPGEVSCSGPYDMVVDSKDRIIVTQPSEPEMYRERVLIFDRDFRWVGTFGSYGRGPGQFLNIAGVAVGPSDILVVCDLHWDANRLSFFFPNGTYAGRIGGIGSCFEYPGAVVVAPGGALLVGEKGPRGLMEIVPDWISLRPIGSSTGDEPHPVPEGVGVPVFLAAFVITMLAFGRDFARPFPKK